MTDKPEIKDVLHMTPELKPYPVSVIDTVLLYKNKSQIAVSADIISYLNTISRRHEEPIEAEDAMRGSLIGTTKFAVQTYYEANARQFTKEHRQEILDLVASILDTQLNQMTYAQVLAH